MGISRDQALDCFRSDDLIGIGMEADAVRRRLHPEGVASYAIEGRIPCAGLAPDAVCAAVADTEELGATGIVLAALSIDQWQPVFAAVKKRFPELSLRALTAKEIRASNWDVTRLHDAGLDSIGTGAGETIDADWIAIHRAAHAAGMKTTATVAFGAGESIEQRMSALDAIKHLHAETDGFRSIAPVSFHQAGGRELDDATAVEYLKTLAITRMYLESIENVESDWTAQGVKVLQMGLRFGGNDCGSVGAGATEEELRRVIRDAGFRPAQRDAAYRVMMLS